MALERSLDPIAERRESNRMIPSLNNFLIEKKVFLYPQVHNGARTLFSSFGHPRGALRHSAWGCNQIFAPRQILEIHAAMIGSRSRRAKFVIAEEDTPRLFYLFHPLAPSFSS